MNGEGIPWAGRGAITVCGVVTILYWLSLAVFPKPIPPLVPLPDLSGLLNDLPPWLRQQVPALNRPDAEVLASGRLELVVALAKIWLQIGAGVASGLLIARRRRSGRVLAIALCGALLAYFVFWQARHAWDHRLVALWTSHAQHFPATVVRWGLDVTFFIGTLAYLTRRPVVLQFATGEQDPC